MNYFLKDIILTYPLNEFLTYPTPSKYLTTQWATALNNTGLYSTTTINTTIERKFKYNEIGTSDVSQFYDMMNQLIEENIYEYWMNLITMSEFYSVQNNDTVNETITHTVTDEGTNLDITNDTPSNRLNIENIKAGSSASNVVYTTSKGESYTDTTEREATSPLNTTQSNVTAQMELNKKVQANLNKFVESLAPAFALVQNEYYGDCY